MKYVTIASLVLVVLFSLAFAQQSATQWEYKFISECNEKKANAAGDEGWELVAVQPPSSVGLGNNVSTYVFKRRK